MWEWVQCKTAVLKSGNFSVQTSPSKYLSKSEKNFCTVSVCFRDVLVKKTDYNTKITEIEKKLTAHNHDKYITTPEFNKLTADVFNAKLAQASLVTKTDFDAKLWSLNRKS